MLSAASTRRAGARAAQRRIVVARASRWIGQPGARVIRVRPGRRARRLLRRGRPRMLVLKAVAVDRAGNRARVRRAVRLSR